MYNWRHSTSLPLLHFTFVYKPYEDRFQLNTETSWTICINHTDSGRRYENLTQCSWQNPESDGILRLGGFSIVSGSTAGVSAQRNQENCGIKLNKSGNPYRPPHSYKVCSTALCWYTELYQLHMMHINRYYKSNWCLFIVCYSNKAI